MEREEEHFMAVRQRTALGVASVHGAHLGQWLRPAVSHSYAGTPDVILFSIKFYVITLS